MPAATHPYQKVVIVGEKFGDAFKIAYQYCNPPDCLLLNPKSEEDVKAALQELRSLNLVNDAHIHITGHGTVRLGNQFISFIPNAVVETSLLLNELYAGRHQPLHVSLYSCYAGAAAKDMPAGAADKSTLTTYGPSDQVTGIELLNALFATKLQENGYLSAASFVQDISAAAAIRARFTTTHGGGRYMYDASALPKDTLHNPHKALDDRLSEFQRYYAWLDARDLSVHPQASLVVPEVNQEAVDQFLKTLLLQAASDQDLDSIGQLLAAAPTELREIIGGARQTAPGSPLMIAASKGFYLGIELLLTHGANPNQASENGVTPLSVAVQKGHREVVELLLMHDASPNQAREDGVTPLYFAVQDGHAEIAALLLKHGANVNQARDDGTTPLIDAAYHGGTQKVAFLLLHGANVNQARDYGATPLLMAAQNGHKEVATLLLAHGANVHQALDNGVTPLFMAVQDGHNKLATLLLTHGANPNKARDDGMTPLMVAALKGRLKVVKMLLDYDADVSAQAFSGSTALIASTSVAISLLIGSALAEKQELAAAFPNTTPSTALLAMKYMADHAGSYTDTACHEEDSAVYSFYDTAHHMLLLCDAAEA